MLARWVWHQSSISGSVSPWPFSPIYYLSATGKGGESQPRTSQLQYGVTARQSPHGKLVVMYVFWEWRKGANVLEAGKAVSLWWRRGREGWTWRETVACGLHLGGSPGRRNRRQQPCSVWLCVEKPWEFWQMCMEKSEGITQSFRN